MIEPVALKDFFICVNHTGGGGLCLTVCMVQGKFECTHQAIRLSILSCTGSVSHRIDPGGQEQLNKFMPVIGEEQLLFGKKFSIEEAEQLVTLGKKTTQAKNCMNCHTPLGNGAYYAPVLTKAWLDQGWITTEIRGDMMVKFLMEPEKNARTFGSGRKMPNLNITEEEALGIVAFLKWMSSIDTNGFPHNFTSIETEE